MESASSLMESSVKSLRGWNGHGTMRVTGMRCTCSPVGLAGAGAGAAVAGAEVEGIEIGALPTEPPMSAPKPRPKAGLAMGEEWRTGWVLSILGMRWDWQRQELICVECKLCKLIRREGVANLEIGRKCDEEAAGNFGQDERDGQDWGRMRIGSALRVKGAARK